MKAFFIFISIFFLMATPMASYADETDTNCAEDAAGQCLLPVSEADTNTTTGTSNTSGKSVNGDIINPLGDVTSPEGLVKKITQGIVNLAIPVAVALIIWTGVQFLLSGGNAEKVTKARKALLWICVGLAVIFIGDGFIALIKDILSVK